MGKHQCFACDQSNPDRIVTGKGDGWILRFGERFVGPPGRAHGGTAIGALTCPILQVAEQKGMLNPVVLHISGRLNRPVPPAKPLLCTMESADSRIRVLVHEDSQLILEGLAQVADMKTDTGTVLQQPPPERLSDLQSLAKLADAEIDGPTILDHWRQSFEAAGLRVLHHECFGCSEAERSLRLRLRIARKGDIWARWESEPGFTDGNGRLAAVIIASALDCANLYTINAYDNDFMVRLLRKRKFYTTGTYGVRFLRVPPIQTQGGYVVTARYLGGDERKFFAMSSLLDRQGTVYAIGEAVAIIIPFPEEF